MGSKDFVHHYNQQNYYGAIFNMGSLFMGILIHMEGNKTMKIKFFCPLKLLGD